MNVDFAVRLIVIHDMHEGQLAPRTWARRPVRRKARWDRVRRCQDFHSFVTCALFFGVGALLDNRVL